MTARYIIEADCRLGAPQHWGLSASTDAQAQDEARLHAERYPDERVYLLVATEGPLERDYLWPDGSRSASRGEPY